MGKRQNRDFKLTAVQVAFLSPSFVSLRNALKSGKITILFDVIMGFMLHVILTQKVVIRNLLEKLGSFDILRDNTNAASMGIISIGHKF